MGRLLADIDAGRSYTGGGIVGEILGYAAGEGFGDAMDRLGVKRPGEPFWAHPAAFRQRFLVAALKAGQ